MLIVALPLLRFELSTVSSWINVAICNISIAVAIISINLWSCLLKLADSKVIAGLTLLPGVCKIYSNKIDKRGCDISLIELNFLSTLKRPALIGS